MGPREPPPPSDFQAPVPSLPSLALWGPRGQGGRRVTCPGWSPEVPKGDAEITSIPGPSAGDALVSGRTRFQPDLSVAQQRWLCRGQASGTRGSPGFYFTLLPFLLSFWFHFHHLDHLQLLQKLVLKIYSTFICLWMFGNPGISSVSQKGNCRPWSVADLHVWKATRSCWGPANKTGQRNVYLRFYFFFSSLLFLRLKVSLDFTS